MPAGGPRSYGQGSARARVLSVARPTQSESSARPLPDLWIAGRRPHHHGDHRREDRPGAREADLPRVIRARKRWRTREERAPRRDWTLLGRPVRRLPATDRSMGAAGRVANDAGEQHALGGDVR